MIITDLRTNHLTNPLGYHLERPVLSWIVEEASGKKQAWARIEVALDPDFQQLVYDSGNKENLSSLGVEVDLKLLPCTRYYWRVTVKADNQECGVSETAWFETGKMQENWDAKWIQAPFEKEIHPYLYRNFCLKAPVRRARVYVTGLGLYELELNGKKVGEDYLAPFYNDYNLWQQYQTYDITDLLFEGDNALGVLLGNGWYKGRFGFVDGLNELYGDQMKFLCEIRIELENGETVTLGSDESWLCCPSPVLESSIYNGEYYDARMEIKNRSTASCDTAGFVQAVPSAPPKGELYERLSPPLVIMERRKPVELLHTPAGELVLDFGQVMTGWVEFNCGLPEGAEVLLQYGELLQQDNFYNENLRTAKQEYRYRSSGKKVCVRPHFTFYGFRYVKVTGMRQVCMEDFTACVIFSKLDRTGEIKTSDEKVNRLFENCLWGQKGNFLDVPTDCPQRDERMGWTGDAQVFAATASFNRYTPAFYRKFLHDVLLEQRQLNGSVPHVVPDILGQIRSILHQTDGDAPHGSCAWGETATVIPWTLWLFYGDKTLLEEQFENMSGWVDYMKNQDDTYCGGSRLWTHGFHFADWLALDNPDKSSSFGGTDCYYVASACYYYSAWLTAKAARVLGKEEEAVRYGTLAGEIKQAVQQEYFTPTGRIAVDTQTGMVLALYLDLVPEQFKERLKRDLKKNLEDHDNHLTTGFVGTPYLCPVLSDNGMADEAYTLLLNEDFPSWLYEVNMGATTIWERWNSVLPDGLVSDTGMNSMNHYAYGSIVEWMYRYMCGINPMEEAPGFKKALLRPQPDQRFCWAEGSYVSASGTYRLGWKWTDTGITYEIQVPFDTEARLVLEGIPVRVLCGDEEVKLARENGVWLLTPGSYKIDVIKPN